MIMYGCRPTDTYGTEPEYRPEGGPEIPEEFSYMGLLPDAADQGGQPLCVPYSISAYVNWKLDAVEGRIALRDIDAWGMYGSKKADGDGMTFKEAFDYLAGHGLAVTGYGDPFRIERYARVGSLSVLRNAIISNGPAMCVLPVTAPSGRDDFWSEKYGDVLGFHAVSVVGYVKDGFILRNSWGGSYGNDGYSLIREKDFKRIIELWTILG